MAMQTEIKSQYKASLKMLTDVVSRCPDGLWDDASYENPYWRIVYHTLFYTALYLAEHENAFRRWDRHLPEYHTLGTVIRNNKPVVVDVAYSKADMLAYTGLIVNDIENALAGINMTGNSGFDWLPMNKLELQFYNIRHIQHHTGQLIERLHQNGISGIGWVGSLA